MDQQEFDKRLKEHQDGENKIWLSREDFTELKLQHSVISKATFMRCQFNDVDMRYSNLSDSQFRNCDMQGADLTGSFLTGVDFTGSNLWNVCINDADLANVRLFGATGIMSLYVPEMSTRGDYLYAVQHDDGVMVKAGCWWGTLDDFVKRIDEVYPKKDRFTKINRKLYRAAIDMIKEWDKATRP